MNLEDAEVGKVYKVNASDCCVSTIFTSRLVEKINDDTLIFENGAKVTGHGVDLEEIK